MSRETIVTCDAEATGKHPAKLTVLTMASHGSTVTTVATRDTCDDHLRTIITAALTYRHRDINEHAKAHPEDRYAKPTDRWKFVQLVVRLVSNKEENEEEGEVDNG